MIKMELMPELSSIHLLLRKKNEGGRTFYSKLGFCSDPAYKREENFVGLELLEALTWNNPKLEHVNDDHTEQSLTRRNME